MQVIPSELIQFMLFFLSLGQNYKVLTLSNNLTSASFFGKETEWATAATNDADDNNKNGNADDDSNQLGKTEN